MAYDPNALPVSPVPDEEKWDPDAERRFDQGEITAHEARIQSGLPVSQHTPGEPAVQRTAGLELVTEDHVPAPNARRERKLRPRPPARTSAEKAARDMGEGLRHKTPPEWAPALTVKRGGQSRN